MTNEKLDLLIEEYETRERFLNGLFEEHIDHTSRPFYYGRLCECSRILSDLREFRRLRIKNEGN